MPATNKVLGQSAPAATTEVGVYTVPASTQAIISTFIACNRSATATTFRLAVAVAGAAADNKQYIYYDLALSGNDTFAATIGMTLGAGDVVRVYAGAATVSFTIFGQELT